MTREELKPLWQADAERLCPGIRLYDEGAMASAVARARRWLQEDNGLSVSSDIGVVVLVLRNLMEQHPAWGVPPHFWWIKACSVFLDDIEIHPWMEVLWKMFDDARGKRKLDTVHGGASTGKTEFLGALAWTVCLVFANASHCYVTSPWKEYGADKVWRVMTRRCDKWANEKPEWMDLLKLEIRMTSDQIVIHNCIKAEAGISTIEFVAVQNSASIQGKKREGQLENNDPRYGAMLVVGDEFLENTNSQFGPGVGNYISNSNAYGLVTCNPKPEKVQEPNLIVFSEPVDIARAELNEDTHFTWKTRRGRLIRLCMANSPNRFTDAAGEPPPFSYLIHKEQAEAQTNWDDSNDVSMVRAWPWASSGTGSLISGRDCERDEVKGPAQWRDAAPVRTMFVDLAFGGRDICSYTVYEFGVNWEGKHILQIDCQGEIKVQKRWTPTEDELKEYRLLHANPSAVADLKAGEEAPGDGDQHVTYEILKKARDLNIPKGNTTYDASMKPDAHVVVSSALGAVKWWYDGNRSLIAEEGKGMAWHHYPPEFKPDKTPVKWSEKVTRIISMAWFFVEALIAHRRIHNLQKGELGWRELIARPRDTTSAGKGLKKDVRGKDRLPRSPTWGEGCALGAYFSVRFCGALPDLFDTAPVIQQEDFDASAYGFETDNDGVDPDCFA